MSDVSAARIILHFDVHEPIELGALTRSLGAVARQYKKFLQDNARVDFKKIDDNDAKLYVTNIENNCILTELAGATDILGTLMPMMDYLKLFLQFAENVQSIIKILQRIASKGEKINPQDIPFTKRQCEDYANFLEVVANSKNGSLGISVAEFAKDDGQTKLHTKFVISGEETFKAQKGAIIAQKALEYKSEADHKDVLMYYHQTNIERSKEGGKTGEKAIIKSIHPKELPVFIISDLDRERIMAYKADAKKNPFKASYRVDVSVETDRNDVPQYYRVLRLHEIIPGIKTDKKARKSTKKSFKKKTLKNPKKS